MREEKKVVQGRQWEYHVLRAQLDKEGYARVVWMDDAEDPEYELEDPLRLRTLYEILQELGAAGWELVAFSPIEGTVLTQYVLKRPRDWGGSELAGSAFAAERRESV